MKSGFQRVMIATFAVLAAAVFSPTAQAAGAACYNDSEFEADRGLRMHSDIEVIMLTCRYSTKGEDLRKVYAKFLQTNVKAIKGWENVIAKTYAGTGASRNEVIDNFRTKLANQKGNEAAKMGPKPFCKEWADYVPFIAGLNSKQIMEYVREPDTTRPTRRERCKT